MRRKERGKKEELPSGFPQKTRGGKTLFSHSFETDTLGDRKKFQDRNRIRNFGFWGKKHPASTAAQIPSIYTTLQYIMLVLYGGNTLPPDCPPFYAVRFPRGGGGGAEAYPQEN